MNPEAKADAGPGIPDLVPTLERESVEVEAEENWQQPGWTRTEYEDDEVEDDLEEGDHALCVPEELEGRLGLHSMPMTNIQWNAAGEDDEGPGARLQAQEPSDVVDSPAVRAVVLPPPFPRCAAKDAEPGVVPTFPPTATAVKGNDPLHNVLNWMEMAHVEEPASSPRLRASHSSCPPAKGQRSGGAASSAVTGLLGGRQGISCLGENARGGSSELSFGSDGESYPDVPSEVQDENDQYCLGVPSDEESRPRPPPYAAHVALMRWSDSSKDPPIPEDDEDLPRMLEPRSTGSTSGVSSALPSQCAPHSNSAVTVVDREEDEWMARKKLTGAIGRLVHYREGQRPCDDIMGLCRTRYGRIKVTALRQNGTAQSAGIEVGDQLISIDGQRPSDRRLAESIRMSIRAPCTLIFMGFAGKLQAEVRVRQPDEPRCGLPHFADVASAACDRRTGSHVELCDAVVFNTPATSLLLEVDAGSKDTGGPRVSPPRQPVLPPSSAPPTALAPYAAPEPQLHSSCPGAVPTEPAVNGSATQRAEAATANRSVSRVYELQREEAKRLVRRALRAGAAIGV